MCKVFERKMATPVLFSIIGMWHRTKYLPCSVDHVKTEAAGQWNHPKESPSVVYGHTLGSSLTSNNYMDYLFHFRYTTVSYRSPEMVDLYSGRTITTKADIWVSNAF